MEGNQILNQNGEFANIYIGFGVKATDLPFYPSVPGDIQNEPEGVEEHYEPYPATEVPKEEPDSLDEGKPADGEEEEN